jgi:hypothetical protein
MPPGSVRSDVPLVLGRSVRGLPSIAGERNASEADTLGGMCRAANCRTCGRPTWKGCGAHVEQVLGHVPPADRCQCKATKPPAAKRRRWLSR